MVGLDKTTAIQGMGVCGEWLIATNKICARPGRTKGALCRGTFCRSQPRRAHWGVDHGCEPFQLDLENLRAGVELREALPRRKFDAV